MAHKNWSDGDGHLNVLKSLPCLRCPFNLDVLLQHIFERVDYFNKTADELPYEVDFFEEGLQLFPACWRGQLEYCLNSIWVNRDTDLRDYVSKKFSFSHSKEAFLGIERNPIFATPTQNLFYMGQVI